jgi:undecaprenyl diphosphate synthase
MAIAERQTAANTALTMVFAFNYGGRAEIVDAVRSIASMVDDGTIAVSDVSQDLISENLYIPDMPDPDLVIRTSGEQRTSNFLLWQAAYSEYVFSPVLWPEFNRAELARCVAEYQNRDRRFGGAEDESLPGGDG